MRSLPVVWKHNNQDGGAKSSRAIVKQSNSNCRINQAINRADLSGICHPRKRLIPVHLETRIKKPNTIKTQFFQAAFCATRPKPVAEVLKGKELRCQKPSSTAVKGVGICEQIISTFYK